MIISKDAIKNILNRILKLDKKVDSHKHNISDVNNLQTTLDGKASSTHNHDSVYSKLGHTHNYAGSSTAGGSATSAITSNFAGYTWATPTQVGTWSALCRFDNYTSGIFSLILDQNSQCGFDTFIVSTGWDSARIYQLGGNGYTDNSGYQLRLVKETDSQYTLEVKNDYGYNGAKTLNIQCRYIVTCCRSGTDPSLYTYRSFHASSGKPEKVKITTSPSGNILTDSINFSNLDSGTRGIGGTIGGSDYWRLVGGASTADEGFVELATADNGTEPIMVSQYTGKFVTRTRRMYLLDSNGDTTIPGNLGLENTKQILGKDTSGAYSNLITMDKYNQVNVGDAKKCVNVVLASKSAKISAFDGTNTYTMYHSGNFNPSNYLPLSGGNLTGDLVLNGASEQHLTFNNCSKSKLQTYFYKGNSTNSTTIIGLWDPTNKEPIWKVNNDWSFEIGKQTTFWKNVIFNNSELTFFNGKGIYGKDSNGAEQRIAVISDACYLGGTNIPTWIRSSVTPQYLDSSGSKHDIYHSGNLRVGGVNNIVNGGFTNGTNGYKPNENTTLTIVDDSASYTGKALKLICPKSNGGIFRWVSSASDSTKTTISFYAKKDSATSSLSITFGFEGIKMANAPLTDKWQRFALTIDAQQGQMLIYTLGAGTFFIHSIKVESGDRYTDWNYANQELVTTKDITTLFERNNGTINKNINTCFDSSSGTFTAPEAGQYLVMCSGYRLSSSDSMYIACVVGYERSNRNELYRTGSSGFTLITLSEKETLQVYKCPAGNVTTECISANSYVNMLIARIK